MNYFPIQLDISNTLAIAKTITFFQLPQHTDVSITAAVAGLIFTSVIILVVIFFLVQTIIHRNSNIMKLSQWPFLVMYLLFSLIAISITVLFIDTNDLSCFLYPIIANVCFGLTFCILIARVWRVYQIIRPLLNSTDYDWRYRIFDLFDRLVSWENCFSRRHHIQNKEITNQDMGRLIVVLFFPMLFGLLVSSPQNDGAELRFYSDYQQSITLCSYYSESGQTIRISLVLMYQFLLFYVAYLARNLPSFLNETSLIFRLTWTNIIIGWFTGAILIINIENMGSPDINVSSN